MVRRTDGTVVSSGCFQDTVKSSATKQAGSNGSSLSHNTTIDFDASDYNSIYSDSATTVTPESFTTVFIIKY